jgi:heptosyltransferase-2
MDRAQRPSRLLTRIGQWLVYALFRCVEGVLAAMPMRVVWHLGRLLEPLREFLLRSEDAVDG